MIVKSHFFSFDNHDTMLEVIEKMKWWKEILPYAVILIVVVLIRTFIVTPIKVHGQSMYDTLNGEEIMILNKLAKINRYDIVVTDLRVNGKKEDTLIKRVFGLPGETIKCENGMIYVNDKRVDDPYAYGKTADFEAVTLGEDEYFVLGDNRLISIDSKVFGAVSKDEILGTTNFIMYPFKSFGKVD